MFSSVRIRLTLWYTAAMTLILVMLASVMYVVIRQNVVKRADAQAAVLADTFLSTVNAEMGDGTKPDSIDEGVSAAISEHRFPDVIFAVFDPQGSLIGMSDISSDEKRSTEGKKEALLSALRPLLAKPQAVHSESFAGYRFRSYVRHFSLEQQPATLIVLQSMRRENDFLDTLTDTFVIIIPLTILIAGAGGYLLARNSLSPVVAMGAQASRIGAENLEARLSVRNPNDELGRLARSFNQLLDRISISFDRQRRFVADASHELRTPVAILCGETEVALAKKERNEQEYREILRILADESRRLKRVVEDLFTLARADAGQLPLSCTDFYLDELASECTKNVRTLAAAKQISVSFESFGEALIRGDEGLLRRMLLNLLDNAIKYTPAAGSVAVRCGKHGDSYFLSVQDSGPGIPIELQPRIFERFFRADKARSRSESDGGGAGLGLSISSWIASAHGGKLELTRSNAEGSVFTAILPIQPLPG
ncbi:MAG: HAMP domain-containing protein [Acidobacteria bacterium]|nr:HAMP domain-containing protein [Acidobacteriota bacterium]MBS1866558.1 HAMP domain-containing protein [Acidobacteriota bacterium]